MRGIFLTLVLALAASSVVACATTRASKTVYRIKLQSGDTLSSIAMKYDTTWERIAKLNGLKPGAALVPGAVLRVEPGPGGIVAGATPIPVGNSRLSKRDNAGPAAASPDEFTEEDLPADGDTPKRRGLLFGDGEPGDNGASLVWPLHGPMSSRFGRRDGRLHQGIDIRAPRGTTVQAAARGIVEFTGRKGDYGRMVVVRHGRVKTVYAHLNSIAVRQGQSVDELTTIGTVGTSGNASGPHLHFEVRNMQDKAFDPLSLLEEEKLLSARH